MAKKNFKGGLDSLIEKSLGMKKSAVKRGDFKGNPIDLVPTSESDEPKEESVSKAKDSENVPTEVKSENEPEVNNVSENEAEKDSSQQEQPEPEPQEPESPKAEASDNQTDTDKGNDESEETDESDSANVAYLKSIIQDMRHELYLWRNGKINVQTFNQTLHEHNLKYNPENNEIEEI